MKKVISLMLILVAFQLANAQTFKISGKTLYQNQSCGGAEELIFNIETPGAVVYFINQKADLPGKFHSIHAVTSDDSSRFETELLKGTYYIFFSNLMNVTSDRKILSPSKISDELFSEILGINDLHDDLVRDPNLPPKYRFSYSLLTFESDTTLNIIQYEICPWYGDNPPPAAEW